MTYTMEMIRVLFPGGCYLCVKCGRPYATVDEVDACATSHVNVPPTNEDR